jgi:four helix bundle protein
MARDAGYENWTAGRFDHEKLDCYRVACEALRDGDRLARKIARGNGPHVDQLRRALDGMHLQIAEAASRSGADRLNRFRVAKAEASEAAAALEGAVLKDLLTREEIGPVVHLLARICAMITGLIKR